MKRIMNWKLFIISRPVTWVANYDTEMIHEVFEHFYCFLSFIKNILYSVFENNAINFSLPKKKKYGGAF